ncbi:MAG TPA: zinc-dependent metalloprotease [Vicinamibacterales bacterium]|nr:zinc-dependent metalloprotease [Vicinamibacterales bacterium]
MLRQHRVLSWALGLAAVAAFVAGASATQVARAMAGGSDRTAWSASDAQQGGGGQGRGGRGGGGGENQAPRPYADVITAEAKTDDGVFKVHRIKDTLFYEIPQAQLDKDFLWVTQIKKTALGAGYGGQAAGNRVVRWRKKDDRILLVNIDYSVISDPSAPIARAVEDANYPAIIRAFPVAAYAPNGDPVIDVTQLFMSEVPELSVRGRVGGRSMDQSRTFLEKVVSFPENVNVEVTQTFNMQAAEGGAAGGGAGRGRGGPSGPTATVLTHYSMVKLPEQPMMGRLFDERVGYFSQGFIDYSSEEQRADSERYITRYRLEKKDPNAELSEPVKPIVYYIDPATPTKYVKYVKQGIEDWQPAFEAAGFKNAIIGMEAPKNDPDWSPEDARYSVIRWLPSTTENASGPHIHDPRTGEILESDIQYYHNVQNLTKNWYFVQAGPLDPRAQKLPLPDELQGELMRYVVAHEVGHTLGFQHNMKASSAYTIEQIRDPKWVKTMGHTPTLMDYSRFNYVAQPEDKIDPQDLIPKIGPYDKWATMWGYKPIPGAKSPRDEKPTLDKWAREQDEKPYLRFSTSDSAGSDPGDQTEAVGDIDAVKATELGLKNLSRVSEMLLAATSTRVGDPWDELEEVYGRMVSQWQTEMNHVVRVVGGFDSQQKHIGQNGVRFVTVAKARQQNAVQFLLQNAFQTPVFMIRPEILRRIQPSGVVDRVRTAQNSVMNGLLQAARLDRMVEQAALDPTIAYPPIEFLGDLRKGVWAELATPATAVNIYRRNLHRSFLDTMDDRLNGTTPPSDELRALFRGELRTLKSEIEKALPGVTDEVTKRHYQDAVDNIETILSPVAMRERGGAAAAPAGRGRGAGPGGGR